MKFIISFIFVFISFPVVYSQSIENVNFTKTTNTPNNSFSKIDKTENSVETNTFQLHQRYIVAQVKSGMLIINQKVAYERIVFEKYFLNEIDLHKCYHQLHLNW